MPLVVPGLMTSGGSNNRQEDWMNKLMGKKISDGASDEMVRTFKAELSGLGTLGKFVDCSVQSFAKKDLPKESRVIEHGSMTTQDHNPDRMNIHLAEDGTVRHVDFK